LQRILLTLHYYSTEVNQQQTSNQINMIRAAFYVICFCFVTTTLTATGSSNPAEKSGQNAGVIKTDTATTVKEWLQTFFESVFEPDDSAAQPQPADSIDWDAEFHLSDPVDTAYNKQHQQPPQNAIRVGCFCMDNTRQDDVGRGACGGRGGVRFWLYHVPGIDSLYSVPTQRHQSHPQALTDMELMQLDAHNPFRQTDKDKNGNTPFIPFGSIIQLLAVVVVCATVLKIVQNIMK